MFKSALTVLCNTTHLLCVVLHTAAILHFDTGMRISYYVFTIYNPVVGVITRYQHTIENLVHSDNNSSRTTFTVSLVRSPCLEDLELQR